MILPARQLWPDGASVDAHGHLTIGGCDTIELARAYGTPLYLLDEATFRTSCRAYRDALARHYPGASNAHYASKALLNSTLARLVAEEALGLDVVSGGELFVALGAGFPAEHIHLHGNAKPRAELEQALAAGIGKIVVDTLDELDLLAQLTAGRGIPQNIMLRLAPDIAADTHAHMETGRASSKFGIPLDALDAAASRILAAPGLRLAGLHTHLGSQILDYAPIACAIGVLLDCAASYAIGIRFMSPRSALAVAWARPTQPISQPPILMRMWRRSLRRCGRAACRAASRCCGWWSSQAAQLSRALAWRCIKFWSPSRCLYHTQDQRRMTKGNRTTAAFVLRRLCAICTSTAAWPTIFGQPCMERATPRCWPTAPPRRPTSLCILPGATVNRAMC